MVNVDDDGEALGCIIFKLVTGQMPFTSDCAVGQYALNMEVNFSRQMTEVGAGD